MNRYKIRYLEKVEQSSPPEIEMRQEEAPIVVFQDGEKAIGRIHQIVDEIYAALGALQLVSADYYYCLNNPNYSTGSLDHLIQAPMYLFSTSKS